MKNKNSIDGCGCLWLLLMLVILGMGVGYFYLIATSGLPDWLKYLLLK